MRLPVYLLLPLLSSWLYVLGALWIKRCTDLGVGVWRTTFMANMVMALAFTPLLALGGPGQPAQRLWQPAVLAALLVLGQWLAFYALSRGDVSVATPVLGVKTLLVALFTRWVLAEAPSLKVWLAAALSTLALGCLHRTKSGEHRRIALTIVASVAAAAVFGLFDVLVQKWSPAWGAGRILPVMAWLVALFSVALAPLFNAPLWCVPRGAWPALAGGASMLALQSLILITTIAVFGGATMVNIVYSSRGLWSVVAVWVIGHWFHNQEQRLGGSVLVWRVLGAGCMTAAIVLVLA